MTAVERRATRAFESVESRRTPYWVVVEQDTVQVGLFESSERRERASRLAGPSKVLSVKKDLIYSQKVTYYLEERERQRWGRARS